MLKVLGDYTTLRIIDALSISPLRFSELQRTLDDTNSVTLTSRLKRLGDAGLLERAEATLNKQSVIYELSDMGKAFLPVMSEMQKFAGRFHGGQSPQPQGG
ncbi:MAG TPA: helix-turn-helix domain-containing protein [Spirochaetia bacterium]|nr:helix-turn-helix domain-containing protein [Spirochaetia bacterium]